MTHRRVSFHPRPPLLVGRSCAPVPSFMPTSGAAPTLHSIDRQPLPILQNNDDYVKSPMSPHKNPRATRTQPANSPSPTPPPIIVFAIVGSRFAIIESRFQRNSLFISDLHHIFSAGRFAAASHAEMLGLDFYDKIRLQNYRKQSVYSHLWKSER